MLVEAVAPRPPLAVRVRCEGQAHGGVDVPGPDGRWKRPSRSRAGETVTGPTDATVRVGAPAARGAEGDVPTPGDADAPVDVSPLEALEAPAFTHTSDLSLVVDPSAVPTSETRRCGAHDNLRERGAGLDNLREGGGGSRIGAGVSLR